MTTLDDYFRSVHPPNRNCDVHIHITVNVVSESRRQAYAPKLETLEKVIREQDAQGRRTSVDSIYYDLLLLGIVKSREELEHLLRIAEHKGRIQQGPHSTWRVTEAWFQSENEGPNDTPIDCNSDNRR